MKLEDVKNVGKVKCPYCGKMIRPSEVRPPVVVICPECGKRI